jgi:hypothetical protein
MGRKEINDFYNSLGSYSYKPNPILLLLTSKNAENV